MNQEIKVLLTGASGMVGRAVLEVLLSRFSRASFRAVRFQNDGALVKNPRVEWVQADLRSMDDCRRVAAGCDSAVMAAATTSGSLGMSMEPWRALNDNVIMNTQMLEAFHHEGLQRVVFISSATVYQEFEGAIKEHELDLNQDPHLAYLGVGWAMRFAEKLCKFWYEKTGIEVVIVRAANVYGPYATFHPQRSNVVPALIRKAVDRMDPFEVWGSPEVVRDVIYVEDFAEVIVRILETQDIKFDIFNVGSNHGHTVGDIVRYALESAGHEPSQVKYIHDVPTTIGVRRLNCTKIRDALVWKPQHSLQEGILKTTRWWIENKNEWKK